MEKALHVFVDAAYLNGPKDHRAVSRPSFFMGIHIHAGTGAGKLGLDQTFLGVG